MSMAKAVEKRFCEMVDNPERYSEEDILKYARRWESKMRRKGREHTIYLD